MVAEAENGSFGFRSWPRHVDFAAALRPGILIYTDAEGRERYLASTRASSSSAPARPSSRPRAVVGDDLESLQGRPAQARYVELDEGQKVARSTLARLELGVVRRFLELQEIG
ncbi:MAG: hypothetical protein R3D25_15950 [Geminicoccaceae bacterium]